MKENILKIKNLKISFKQYSGMFSRKEIVSVKDLNVSVNKGEITAIVGASGSGKSLLAHAVFGILPYNAEISGEIFYNNEILDRARTQELIGREIVLVPQSTSYLDPLMKLEEQILKGDRDRERRAQLTQIFSDFHLKDEVRNQYPFEMSGGMTRRILISTALIEEPKLVIADEPTPGLDLKMAKRVMEHFRKLADMGAGVLVITHDLELALQTVDRIVIFNEGRTVEELAAEDFMNPDKIKHPYTKKLYYAMPQNGFALFREVK